jgi:hypothetical protein
MGIALAIEALHRRKGEGRDAPRLFYALIAISIGSLLPMLMIKSIPRILPESENDNKWSW